MSAWGVGKTLAEQLKEQKEEEAIQITAAEQPCPGIHSGAEENKKNLTKKKESQSTAQCVVPPTASEAPAAAAAAVPPLKEDKPLPQENKEKKGKGITTSEKRVVHMPSSWAVHVSSSIHFSGSAPAAAAGSEAASASLPPKKGKRNGAAPTPGAVASISKGKGISPTHSSRSASTSSTKETGRVLVGQKVALSPSPSAAHAPVRPVPSSHGGVQAGASAGESRGGPPHGNRRNKGAKWRNHRGGRRTQYDNSHDVDWGTGFIPGGEFGAIPLEYFLAKEGEKMHPQAFYNGFPPPQQFSPLEGGSRFPYHPSSFPPFPPHPTSSHGPYPGGRVDYTIGYPCFGNPSILPYTLGGYEHPNGHMGPQPGQVPFS